MALNRGAWPIPEGSGEAGDLCALRLFHLFHLLKQEN